MVVDLAAGPSGAAVGVIVGSATVTIAAMWAVLGYFARRFLAQQDRNHADTLEVRDTVRQINHELPRLGFRITRLEGVVIVGAAVAAWQAWRRK